MKGTKQWKTASKWRRLCHQVGQLILYTLNPCEVNVSDTIQWWIAVIKTTGHESSCKPFCTIQIKVAANTPQIPHMVKTWATDCWYIWAKGEILSNITPRSSIGNIERYLLRCRSFSIRRNSVLSGFSISIFVDIHDWTEAKHDCKPFSATEESHDAKETYSWLSSV